MSLAKFYQYWKADFEILYSSCLPVFNIQLSKSFFLRFYRSY